MSFFRTTPPTFPFQSYLFPSLPFRRRKSSTDSAASTSSTSSYLPHHASYLRCTRCSADLCSTTAIVSRGFTGRWGRAYLVSAENHNTFLPRNKHSITGSLPNTTTERPVARQLVTGPHTVSDIRCAMCHSVLGWKYIAAAEEAQKYKVGKYILETKRVGVWTRWEDDSNEAGEMGDAGLGPAPTLTLTPLLESLGTAEDQVLDMPVDDVEFDSQDEDECEDLFMGVWTPELALRRRAGKSSFMSGFSSR